MDKATADANGIVDLSDIGDNPAVAALFDTDGNGKAELFGCNDGGGCQIVINDTIALNGWKTPSSKSRLTTPPNGWTC